MGPFVWTWVQWHGLEKGRTKTICFYNQHMDNIRYSSQPKLIPQQVVGDLWTLLMVLYLPPASGKPELQLACHREVALHHTFSPYPPDLTEHHADIISAIHKVVEQCSYTMKWQHVKGHQDEQLITALPWDAWLNIKANQLAWGAIQLATSGNPI